MSKSAALKEKKRIICLNLYHLKVFILTKYNGTFLNDRSRTDHSMKIALNSNAYLPAFNHSKKKNLKPETKQAYQHKKTVIQLSMFQELSIP